MGRVVVFLLGAIWITPTSYNVHPPGSPRDRLPITSTMKCGAYRVGSPRAVPLLALSFSILCGESQKNEYTGGLPRGLAGRSRCVHGFTPLIPHHLPRSSTALLVDILPLAAHSLVERYGILQPRHCFSIGCRKQDLWWNSWGKVRVLSGV